MPSNNYEASIWRPPLRGLLSYWAVLFAVTIVTFIAVDEKRVTGVAAIFAAFSAVLAALIAYRAAMLKHDQEERHRAEDWERRVQARHIQAARAGRAVMYRVYRLMSSWTVSKNLSLGEFRAVIHFYVRSLPKSLTDCLENASELTPRILVQLHRLQAQLEYLEKLVDVSNNQSFQFTDPVIKDGEWLSLYASATYRAAEHVLEISKAVIVLARQYLGNEFTLDDEETMNLAKQIDEASDIIVFPVSKDAR